MSSALNRAIYARLTGGEALTGIYGVAQGSLAGLLAPDPDTAPVPPATIPAALPLVVKGNVQDATAYPCITFRESGGVGDPRFTMGGSVVGLGTVVDELVYDFEVWGKSRSGVELGDIDKALQLLIDRRYGVPVMPLTDGLMRWSESMMLPHSDYDSRRNAWFLVRRVRFTVQWNNPSFSR